MFKRLKEKISEEVKQSPLRQYTPFKEDPSTRDSSDAAAAAVAANGSCASAQNLIDLHDSVPSAAVDLSASEGFSIGDDDDGLPSQMTSPTRTPVASFENVDLSDELSSPTSPDPSNGSSRRPRASSVDDSASGLFPIYSPAAFNHSVQSDLESASEVDDSVVNLDAVSKARLYEAFQKAKSRYVKYKTRYGGVVKAYKDQLHETDKIRSILTESQDKALRRISELKEQTQLDQKAKQHLEENFREMLDEKEELVRVLQTQVRLLKTGVSSAAEDRLNSNDGQSEGDGDVDLPKKLLLQEDTINKLKNLLKTCKETIVKQRGSLAEAEAEASARMACFADELQRAAERTDELERRDEDRAVQMAESKRRVHEDMEAREENERRLEEQLQRVVVRLDTEQLEKSKLAEELEAVRSTVADASTVSDLENELAELQATLKKVESKSEMHLAEKSGLQSDVARLSEEVGKLSGQLEAESQRNADLELNRAELAALVSDSEACRAESTRKLTASDERIVGLESDLKAEQLEISRTKSMLAELEEELMKTKEDVPAEGALQKKRNQDKLKEMKFTETVQCLRRQLSEIRSSLDEEREDFSLAFESLVTANRELQDRFGVHESDAENARQEVVLLKQALEMAENSVEEANRNSENLVLNRDSEVENLTSKLNRAEADFDDATREAVKLKQEMDVLRVRCEQVDTENGSIRSINEELDREVGSLKAEIEVLTREVSSLKAWNEVLDQEVRTATSVKKQFDDHVESLKMQMTSLDGEIADVRRQRDDLEAVVDSARNKNANLELEAANRFEEIVEVHRAELDRLSRQHEASTNDVNRKYEVLIRDTEARLVAEKTAAIDVLELQIAGLKSSIDRAKIVESELGSSEASMKDIVRVLREENDSLVLERSRLLERLEDSKEELCGHEAKFEAELASRGEESREARNALDTEYKEKLALVFQEKTELSSALEANEECIRRLRDESESIRDQKSSEIEEVISPLKLSRGEDQDRHEAELAQLRQEYERKYDELISEKEGLSAAIAKKNEQIDESLVLAQDNEMRSSKVQRELQVEARRQRDELEQLLRSQSDEHVDEIRRVTRHFEQVIAEREAAAADELAAAIERGQNDDNRLRRERAEQLRDIGIEITEKEVALETALEESRGRNKTLESELESLREEQPKQLRAVEAKWKSILDRESRKFDSAHCEEVDGLYREWQIEKKVPFNSDVLNSEELQKEASLATLVLGSGDQSSNLLRRQIMAMQKQMEALKDCHRNEVEQLKDAMRTNNCPIPPRLMDGKSRDYQRLESLEIEYLKNILFEYMMGRERLTMAKVISAVVRFSDEQTSKVIEREESRSVGGQIVHLLK